MMEQQISVAGRGVAELPIPAWLKLTRAALVATLSSVVLTGAFLLNGWRWVTDAGADGLSAGFALWCALLMTAAVGLPVAAVRSGWLASFLNIRKTDDGRAVFGGFRSVFRPVLIFLVTASLGGASAWFAYASYVTCPLPDVIAKVHLETTVPGADTKLIPIYLWDYATWIDPEWLDHINVVVPYEKGPPQRLLPKIFFEDSRTHSIVLELHGKRPRSYRPEDVYAVFNAPVAQPRDWPLIWRLEREAGLTTDGLAVPVLSLVHVKDSSSSDVTRAIGVPWEVAGRPESGRLFYWGPDGSVFQVKCPAPCAMARTLELIRFPRDPKGSRGDRLEWTRGQLRKLLSEAESAKNAGAGTPTAGPETVRRENLLSLYLVSALTLDPRDPEAYFHLGKLARNLTTARSAILYGRDVGLEHEKLVELEGVADRLSP